MPLPLALALQLLPLAKDVAGKAQTSALGAIGAGTKLYDSIVMNKKLRQLQNQYHRPVLQTPASLNQAIGLEQNAYNAPIQQTALQNQQNNANTAMAVRNAQNSGISSSAALGAGAAAQLGLNAANRQSMIDAMNAKTGQRQTLEGLLKSRADQENAQFDYNKKEPFNNAVAAEQAYYNAGREDRKAALNDLEAAYTGNAKINQGISGDALGALNGLGGDKQGQVGKAGAGSVMTNSIGALINSGDNLSGGNPSGLFSSLKDTKFDPTSFLNLTSIAPQLSALPGMNLPERNASPSELPKFDPTSMAPDKTVSPSVFGAGDESPNLVNVPFREYKEPSPLDEAILQTQKDRYAAESPKIEVPFLNPARPLDYILLQKVLNKNANTQKSTASAGDILPASERDPDALNTTNPYYFGLTNREGEELDALLKKGWTNLTGVDAERYAFLNKKSADAAARRAKELQQGK